MIEEVKEAVETYDKDYTAMDDEDDATADKDYATTEINERSSLNKVIIRELMEWDPKIGYPEPLLVHKKERCDEGDMGEMFSRTKSQFAGKFIGGYLFEHKLISSFL